jgi:hypothetical protein
MDHDLKISLYKLIDTYVFRLVASTLLLANGRESLFMNSTPTMRKIHGPELLYLEFATTHMAFASCKIVSDAFILIMNTGITGKPPGTLGKALTSTTLRPVVPLTLNFESSTAIGSLSAPIAQLLLA